MPRFLLPLGGSFRLLISDKLLINSMVKPLLENLDMEEYSEKQYLHCLKHDEDCYPCIITNNSN